MNESFCSEILLLVLLYKVYRLLKYRGDFFPCKKQLAFMGLVNTSCPLVGLSSTNKKTVTTDKLRNAPTMAVTFIIDTNVSLVSTPKQWNRNNVILRLGEDNRLPLCGIARCNTRQND